MSAVHLDYFGDWKERVLTCPGCGWKGTFDDGEVELYGELMDSSCPECDSKLAVVSYPTLAETRANVEKLGESDRRELEQMEQRAGAFQARCLKSPGELPDVDGERIELVWDLEDEDVVIRHGDRVLWKEPRVWEGHERFAEVLTILEAKYRGRLCDLAPTGAGELYLYGDELSAADAVEELRAALRKRAGEG